MRDLFLAGFLATYFTLALRRPFLFVLAYVYVDIVAPQLLGYYLLSDLKISLVAAALAIGSWLLVDAGKGFSISFRQLLMTLLLVYCGVTTLHADFPEAAFGKWDWAWKALFFAIFLPFTLRTKLRIEAFLLVMMLSLAALVVTGGIKTLLSGGGYGALVILVQDNSGLYEGSIISCVAVASIPVILWLTRHSTIFPTDWRVKTFGYALCFACLLIPIGTQARTGLVCIAVLFVLMLRHVRYRFLYAGGAAMLALAAVPFLPQGYTDRMSTIQGYQADASASTRIAVWGWTLDYVKERPFGGGFEAYLQNRFNVQTVSEEGTGTVQNVSSATVQASGRAWHSAFFEMLGEQGFPGLAMFLLIHLIGLVRMERLRRRYREATGEDAWIAPLAGALQNFQIVFLVGGAFVAVAFQPFPWMIIAAQIGFDQWVSRREAAGRARPFGPVTPPPKPQAEPA